MSVGYIWVQWNRHKRVYDAIVAGAIVIYLGAFVGISKALWTGVHAVSDEIVVIRATGSCAVVLLHVILCIGPLARLDRRFLPLLYNRRHLGVITCLVALVHGVLVLGYYHGFGVLNPLISLLTSNTEFGSFTAFPFELLGLGALLIMVVMAATSHDFWLKNLSPRVWKGLHMLVYLAYGLLVGHVALGALQNDRGWVGPALMGVGLVTVVGLHLAAGWKEVRRDAAGSPGADPDHEWIDVGSPAEIPDRRARTVCTRTGERIAVFKHDGKVSAVTNVCAHQGGPLGEGKIIDGCITCPWHGWQYKAEDGRSPPPFQEKIATYQVRIVAGRVQVKAEPMPSGTRVEPAVIPVAGEAAHV